MEKNNNKSKLRFPGFTDPWEQRKLGDVTKSYSGGTPSVGKSEYYDGNIPFIRSAEINSDSTELYISQKGLNSSSAKKVKVGDILYALYGATSGEVGISRINGAINQAILAIQPEKGYNSQFIMQWLCGQKQKITDKYLQGGQGNLSGSIVKDLSIEFPSYDEQYKIGTFFNNLDNLITLHQRKLNHLQDKKKGLLQKMFPKNGEDFPELRFLEFTDSWEQRKLDKILKERKVKQKITKELPLLAFASGQGVIDRSERKTNNRDFLTKDSTKKMYLLTKYNDIVYNPSNLKYGAIDRNKHGQGVISPIYVTFETDEIPSFIELIVKSENFKQRALQYEEGTVTKRQSVKPENLLCLNVVLPNSKDEQKKIGKLFEQIDDTITLHQRKLEHLQQQKKGLLQQMFI